MRWSSACRATLANSYYRLQNQTASVKMIDAVATFLDENADALTPEQEDFAAVFLLEYVGKRAISMWRLIEKCKHVGIHLYWSKRKAGDMWRVRFK